MLYERQVPWKVLRKTSRTTYRFLLYLTSIQCNVYMYFICMHLAFKHVSDQTSLKVEEISHFYVLGKLSGWRAVRGVVNGISGFTIY